MILIIERKNLNSKGFPWCSLKAWDESGLVANNEVQRSARLKLARRTNESDNLEDCINRLWLGSDPKG